MDSLFKTLLDSINSHDNIVLMTHADPDLDGMGAAIVFSEIVKKIGKNVSIVAPKKICNKSLLKAITYIENSNEVISFKHKNFIDVHNTLLIMFDFDEIKRAECTELIHSIKDKIVIDHHTRGNDVVSETICEILDENKSSTVEMVGDFLRYLDYDLHPCFYTLMLAGLYIDTNGFNLKTSCDTFDFASFLIQKGADNVEKQKILKNSMETILNIYSYIEKCAKLKDGIYLCLVDDCFCDSTELAMMADKMLKFEGVRLSLAVGMSSSSLVMVSARSDGSIDVSKMMKKIGGGGHHSQAAAQVESLSMDEVVDKLKLLVKGE